MARKDLPWETDRMELDYRQLVSTLEMIEGELVIVRISPRDGESIPGTASIVGELKHEVPARYEGHEFSIGSPFAARNPEHLAGGVLYINEAAFESAFLTTFDGNDYFGISITTPSIEILVQDGYSAP